MHFLRENGSNLSSIYAGLNSLIDLNDRETAHFEYITDIIRGQIRFCSTDYIDGFKNSRTIENTRIF
jgi:hypothetical protein